MILKTKAIEPKTSSALSNYPAIIIDKSNSSNNTAFTMLQIFCPSVMSGTLEEAKYCINNWISAPRYIVKTNDEKIKHDYRIGGLVLVSYQDGNINTPQFVNEIPIDDDVIQTNAMYIGGVDIAADTLLDIFDTSLDLTSPGLKKGLALLPALKACNNLNLRHFYGYKYTKDKEKLTTIYRCGVYGTEFIYKPNDEALFGPFLNIKEANFNFLDDRNSPQFRWLSICQRLLEVEDRNVDDKCLVDVFNKAIIANETTAENKNAVFDKTNDADTLYLYTKLAGYIYANHAKTSKSDILDTENIDKKYDKSNKLSPDLSSKVAKEGLKFSTIPNNYYSWLAFNSMVPGDVSLSAIASPTVSLYRGTFRRETNNLSEETLKIYRDATFNFINHLFAELCSNDFFNNQLATCYTIILTNNLLTFKQTYGADFMYNKALLIFVVIASAFPTLQKTLENVSVITEKSSKDAEKSNFTDKDKKFLEKMRDCIKDITETLPTTEEIAAQLTVIYFEILGWTTTEITESMNDTDDNSIFDYDKNAVLTIQNCMSYGIKYILNNYDTLKETLNPPVYYDETTTTTDSNYVYGNPSQYGFIWPTPTSSRVTSPFGPRKSSYHYGIDIGLPTGSDVVAIADGVVTRVGWQDANNPKVGYGKRIYIDHGNGVSSRYAHLNDFTVKLNDKVSQGQVIAHSDNTGHSTGPHLHFEIRFGGVAKNPLEYVSANNKAGQKTQTNYNASASGNGPSSAKSGKYYNVNLSHDVQDHLFSECNTRGVSVALMLAVIKCESSFNPKADSGSSVGLCQINRINFNNLRKTLGITDFFDPKQNITCGVYMLSGLFNTYGTDTEGCHHALTAYNRGANGAKKYYQQYGTYHSNYSNKVMNAYYSYL